MAALIVYVPNRHPGDWFWEFTERFVREHLAPRYRLRLAQPIGTSARAAPVYAVHGGQIEVHWYSLVLQDESDGMLRVVTMHDHPLDHFRAFGFRPDRVSQLLAGQFIPSRLRAEIDATEGFRDSWGSLERSPVRPWLYRTRYWQESATGPAPQRNRRGLYFRGLHSPARDAALHLARLAQPADDVDIDCWAPDDKRDVPADQYFRKLAMSQVALSLPGAGDLCHRDIECFRLGVPVLRPMLQAELAVPLVAGEHYIGVPFEPLGPPHQYPDHPKDPERLAADLLATYRRVRNDEPTLRRIASNARRYYDEHLAYPAIAEHTLRLLGLDAAPSTTSASIATNVRTRPPGEVSPELCFVAACARAERSAQVVADLPTADFDWNRVRDLAIFHGLAAPVASALERVDGNVGAVALVDLRVARLNQVGGELIKFARWRRINQALAEAGIKALTLKGFHVAFLLYGGTGQRVVGDLDFLVHARDVAATIDVLRSLGFHLTRSWERAIRHVGLERVLASTVELALGSADGVAIDLHWHAGPSGATLSTEELLADAPPGIGGEPTALGSPLGDTMAMLVTHGEKSIWKMLRWLVDIDAGLHLMQDADAARMEEHLERVHGQQALANALELIRLVWGSVPGSARGLRPLPAADRRFVTEALLRFERDWDSVRVFDRQRPWRLLAERLRLRGATLPNLLEAARPSYLDWAVVPLPSWLHVAYYAIRPVRVLSEAARRGRRGLPAP